MISPAITVSVSPYYESGIGPFNCLMAAHFTDGETKILRGVLARGHTAGTIWTRGCLIPDLKVT